MINGDINQNARDRFIGMCYEAARLGLRVVWVS
jgi:hypothetical protein